VLDEKVGRDIWAVRLSCDICRAGRPCRQSRGETPWTCRMPIDAMC
jgi:hypothetical protein